MNKPQHDKITLPALRGVMGDWVYYSSLMTLTELSVRVNFAEEVHNNPELSQMIQRHLKEGRGKQIAAYLQNQPERFFSSLVIATYGGQPNWHAIDTVQQKSRGHELSNLPATTIASVGFLTLHGDERLFAVDGQHRLAGIKKAVQRGIEDDPPDEVSVIFVAHSKTKAGLERTRRLFTTLNKTAKPVSKGDIIALDEDDVMAICVRQLIENTELFGDKRVAFVANNNMPRNNFEALTTIGTLYDVLTILFTAAHSDLKKSKADLVVERPQDAELKKYFAYAQRYFELLGKHFPEMKAFFGARNYATVTAKHRHAGGGNMMFRPIGLEVMTRIIARLTKDMSLEAAVKRAALLPRELNYVPYKGLMWDMTRKVITNAHKATLRDVLLHTLGVQGRHQDNLLKRYRKDSGYKSAALPKPLPK